MSEEIRVLTKALEQLRRNSDGLRKQGTWAVLGWQRLLGTDYLMRMLSETLAEFTPEPGHTIAVACNHCYDNVNIANILIGEPVWEYWKDDPEPELVEKSE